MDGDGPKSNFNLKNGKHFSMICTSGFYFFYNA